MSIHENYILWQVTIWDRFAKIILPLIVIFGILFYLYDQTIWTTFMVISAVLFVSAAVTWWFWVIYTIASIALLLRKSNRDLGDVVTDLKNFRKTIDKNKN